MRSPELLAVADGVGGNVGGATASALAITSLVAQRSLLRDRDPEGQLRRAVSRANRRLGDACSQTPGLAGMATTLTAVALTGEGRMIVAHVGDSRAYLLRGGKLVALTRDHSVVQAMLDAGSISAEQARRHPWRSMLLAALHGREDDTVDVETSAVQALPGDRVLLCSDGLWGVVSAVRIQQALMPDVDAPEAAFRLLQSAQSAPARDNITVIVADVTTAEAAGGPTTVVGAAARDERMQGPAVVSGRVTHAVAPGLLPRDG